MKRKTQTHDVGVILAEFHGGSLRGKVSQLHFKEVDREFAVQIVQLIITLPVGGVRTDLLKVVLASAHCGNVPDLIHLKQTTHCGKKSRQKK